MKNEQSIGNVSRRFSACEDLSRIQSRKLSNSRGFSADDNCLAATSVTRAAGPHGEILKKRNQVILLRRLICSISCVPYRQYYLTTTARNDFFCT